jgi:mercuric ion transport protein
LWRNGVASGHDSDVLRRRAGGIERFSAGETGRKRLVALGGVIGAIAASSCCVIPLALFGLGVGGAWIGNLTALAPFKPYTVAATLGLLGYGYYLVYRKPKAACAEGEACARPGTDRFVKFGLWFATALVALAMSFNWTAPLLFGG